MSKDELCFRMRSCKARRKILFLDCCHQGIDCGRGGGLKTAKSFVEVNELAEGYACLSATTARQKAAEDGDHGVFTRFILEAIEGHAGEGDSDYVTFHDIVKYVTKHVRPYCLKKGYLMQEPTYRYDGMGDMIVVRRPPTETNSQPLM